MIMLLWFALIGLQDDGFGACPAFQHSHADSPGVCFRDDNDAPISAPIDPTLDLA